LSGGILSIEWPFIIRVDLKVAVAKFISGVAFMLRRFNRSSWAKIPIGIREKRKARDKRLIVCVVLYYSI
jgi:hypothetical protein